jgi:tRNA(Arg) A34 adenosine deaminase TadA
MNSNTKNNLLNQVIPQASQSTIEHRLAAGILRGHKIISKICCNVDRNICRSIEMGSLHAEAHAITCFFGKYVSYDKEWKFNHNKKNIDMIVVRVNKMGETLNARPCFQCVNMMRAAGIHKIYYSVSNNILVCENVKDIISIQSSAVTRHIYQLKNNIKNFSTEKYYESLLKIIFPKIIKKINLENFLKYNFVNVLPTYKTQLNTIHGHSYISIYDTNNNVIAVSRILQ